MNLPCVRDTFVGAFFLLLGVHFAYMLHNVLIPYAARLARATP